MECLGKLDGFEVYIPSKNLPVIWNTNTHMTYYIHCFGSDGGFFLFSFFCDSFNSHKVSFQFKNQKPITQIIM